MSSSFHQKTKKFDPLGHSLVEAVFGIEKQEKKQAEAEAAATKASADQDASNLLIEDKMKVRQVETRRGALQAGAAAAGATRIGDDRDLATTGSGTKRRQASRLLLGE